MRAAAALLIVLLSVPAWAGERLPAPRSPGAGTLVVRLGTPARARAVRELHAEASRSGVGATIEFARALGRAGGVAAAEGLADIVRHRDPRVRVAALEAAARVGLRDVDLVERVREVLVEQDVEVARAACAAIGRIGDGGDVVTLLELARREGDPKTRLAAYEGLEELSGQNIPPVHVRWTYWWRTAERRTVEAIGEAVDYLDEHPAGSAAAYHERVLTRLGWIELESVDQVVRRWLAQPNKVNRARACRLAGALGLVARVTEIRPLTRFAFDGALEAAAEEALRRLGYREPEAR